ncbi:MAG: MATE family efflux transporter [Lachnospiraceae bacterium]|nr:MATE family efflux transporter [Lachnospiraceae bacterium]
MDRSDKRIYTLSSEKPVVAVLKTGVPLVLGMFVMVFYNLVDTFFIGKLNDDYQMAAVNLGYPVMMIMIAVGNMVGTGGSSVIARFLGAGDTDKAEHTLCMGYVLTLVNSLALGAAGLLFLQPLVSVLGAAENTFGYTADYVSVLLAGGFFLMGNYTFGQLMRAEGSVKYSMIGMMTGAVANIVLDPIFIFGLSMGVKGAAVATVFGNAAGSAVMVFLYIIRKTILKFHAVNFRPDFGLIMEIYRVGIPASLETAFSAATFVVLNNLAVDYGELAVAGMGISQKVMSFGSYIYQGFAAGLQPLMGYNCGAKNFDRMLKLLKANVLVTGAVEIVVMVIFGIFAPVIIGRFTINPVVIRYGCRVLRANMFILPFVGATSSSRATFQSMGKPLYALGITIVRQGVLYIPLLLLMNTLFDFYGLIWAQPVTELITMIGALVLMTGFLKSARNNVQDLQAG